jgi:hypothetical protein
MLGFNEGEVGTGSWYTYCILSVRIRYGIRPSLSVMYLQ